MDGLRRRLHFSSETLSQVHSSSFHVVLELRFDDVVIFTPQPHIVLHRFQYLVFEHFSEFGNWFINIGNIVF